MAAYRRRQVAMAQGLGSLLSDKVLVGRGTLLNCDGQFMQPDRKLVAERGQGGIERIAMLADQVAGQGGVVQRAWKTAASPNAINPSIPSTRSRSSSPPSFACRQPTFVRRAGRAARREQACRQAILKCRVARAVFFTSARRARARLLQLLPAPAAGTAIAWSARRAHAGQDAGPQHRTCA